MQLRDLRTALATTKHAVAASKTDLTTLGNIWFTGRGAAAYDGELLVVTPFDGLSSGVGVSHDLLSKWTSAVNPSAEVEVEEDGPSVSFYTPSSSLSIAAFPPSLDLDVPTPPEDAVLLDGPDEASRFVSVCAEWMLTALGGDETLVQDCFGLWFLCEDEQVRVMSTNNQVIATASFNCPFKFHDFAVAPRFLSVVCALAKGSPLVNIYRVEGAVVAVLEDGTEITAPMLVNTDSDVAWDLVSRVVGAENQDLVSNVQLHDALVTAYRLAKDSPIRMVVNGGTAQVSVEGSETVKFNTRVPSNAGRDGTAGEALLFPKYLADFAKITGVNMGIQGSMVSMSWAGCYAAVATLG